MNVFAIDIFFSVSAAFCMLGIICSIIAHVRWKLFDTSAYGKIVEIQTYINHDDYLYSVPIIEFAVGMKTVRSRARSAKPKGLVDKKMTNGQAVEVIYNSKRPSSFIVKGYDKNVLLILGNVLIIGSLIVMAIVFIILYKQELLPSITFSRLSILLSIC